MTSSTLNISTPSGGSSALPVNVVVSRLQMVRILRNNNAVAFYNHSILQMNTRIESLTRHQVTGIEHDNGRIKAVRVKNRLTGDERFMECAYASTPPVPGPAGSELVNPIVTPTSAISTALPTHAINPCAPSTRIRVAAVDSTISVWPEVSSVWARRITATP